MAAATAGIGGIERQRQPELDARVVHVVAGRHDADDARRHTVDGNRAPDDRLVAAERAPPELARQDGDVFGARQRVFARELPAANRRDAQDRHQLEVMTADVHAARLVRRAEVDRASAVGADLLRTNDCSPQNSMNSGAETQN